MPRTSVFRRTSCYRLMNGIKDMVGYRATLNLSFSLGDNSSQSCSHEDDVETGAILVSQTCMATIIAVGGWGLNHVVILGVDCVTNIHGCSIWINCCWPPLGFARKEAYCHDGCWPQHARKHIALVCSSFRVSTGAHVPILDYYYCRMVLVGRFIGGLGLGQVLPISLFMEALWRLLRF